MTKQIIKEDWQEIGKAMETLREADLFPAIGHNANGWGAWVFLVESQKEEQHTKAFAEVLAETATEAMRNLLVEPKVVNLLKITRRDPKDATAEELLEAAIWFYCQDMEPLDRQEVVFFLRTGWNLARPGGWRHISPWWLQRNQTIHRMQKQESLSKTIPR